MWLERESCPAVMARRTRWPKARSAGCRKAREGMVHSRWELLRTEVSWLTSLPSEGSSKAQAPPSINPSPTTLTTVPPATPPDPGLTESRMGCSAVCERWLLLKHTHTHSISPPLSPPPMAAHQLPEPQQKLQPALLHACGFLVGAREGRKGGGRGSFSGHEDGSLSSEVSYAVR